MTLFDRRRSTTVEAAVFAELRSQARPRLSWIPRGPERAMTRSSAAPPKVPRAPSAAPKGASLPPDPLPVVPEDVQVEPISVSGALLCDAAPRIEEAPLRHSFFDLAALRSERAMTSLEAAIAACETAREHVATELERELVVLACAIAQRVIQREVRVDPRIIVDLARAGIEALVVNDRLLLRFGEGLAEEHVADLRESLKLRGASVEVVVDASIGLGGCVVETEFGRVDESVQSRLDAVMQAMLPEEDDL